MQAVIQLGRTARERRSLPLKFPLNKITIVHKDEQYRKDVESLKSFIVEELNVRDVTTSSDDTQVSYIAKPDFKALGTKLRKDLPKVQQAIKGLLCLSTNLIFRTNARSITRTSSSWICCPWRPHHYCRRIASY
jgi:isoleucyl-tRNA synthetase